MGISDVIDEFGVFFEQLASKNETLEKMLHCFDMSQSQIDTTVKRIEDGEDVKTVLDETYHD